MLMDKQNENTWTQEKEHHITGSVGGWGTKGGKPEGGGLGEG